jgi:uncharacterized membrane protein
MMKKYIFSFLLIAAGFVISIVALPDLPDQMAAHWNVNGEPDQYWNKGYAAFFGPILMLVMMGLLVFLPKIDPKKENYKKFSGSYQIFINLLILFFFVLHIVTIGFNLGYDINISVAIILMIGVFYIIIGNYMPRIKHNYFVGIRTPWTLANEKVWTKTHQLGGKVFVVLGICMFPIVFLPGAYKFTGLMVLVGATVLILFVSSYVFFNRYKHENKGM